MFILKIIKNYWKSAVITAVILHLSFASPSEFKQIPTFDNEDKLVHFLMYAGLAIVLFFDNKKATFRNTTSGFWYWFICLIFPIFLGGIIEILQPMYFAPRSASWFDWMADILGALVGWIIMKTIYKKLNA